MVGEGMILANSYIFVHVPKTGGQSVSAALGGKSTSVSTHTPLAGVDREGRFAFGFVRNPWERMVSLYHFLCQKTFKHTDNFNQPEVRAAGFKRWLLEHEFYMQEDYLPNGECWVVGGYGELPPMQRRPQLWWLDGCDYIGRCEHLQKDFNRVCERIGIRVAELPHINKTKHQHYRGYYDGDTRDFIEHYFQPEIERFGYRF